jgi:hypothetical protein
MTFITDEMGRIWDEEIMEYLTLSLYSAGMLSTL